MRCWQTEGCKASDAVQTLHNSSSHRRRAQVHSALLCTPYIYSRNICSGRPYPCRQPGRVTDSAESASCRMHAQQQHCHTYGFFKCVMRSALTSRDSCAMLNVDRPALRRLCSVESRSSLMVPSCSYRNATCYNTCYNTRDNT
jgi:hypothetical protein